MKTLDIVHPAAKALVDISLSQARGGAQRLRRAGAVAGGAGGGGWRRVGERGRVESGQLACGVAWRELRCAALTGAGAAPSLRPTPPTHPHTPRSAPGPPPRPPLPLPRMPRWGTAPPPWCCWLASSSKSARRLWRRACTRAPLPPPFARPPRWRLRACTSWPWTLGRAAWRSARRCCKSARRRRSTPSWWVLQGRAGWAGGAGGRLVQVQGSVTACWPCGGGSHARTHPTTGPAQPTHPTQVSGERDFFAEMVVQAVTTLDPESVDLRMLGVKKVQGGGLRDSFLVDGVAFKKTFSYAGFEMQPKSYDVSAPLHARGLARGHAHPLAPPTHAPRTHPPTHPSTTHPSTTHPPTRRTPRSCCSTSSWSLRARRRMPRCS